MTQRLEIKRWAGISRRSYYWSTKAVSTINEHLAARVKRTITDLQLCGLPYSGLSVQKKEMGHYKIETQGKSEDSE